MYNTSHHMTITILRKDNISLRHWNNTNIIHRSLDICNIWNKKFVVFSGHMYFNSILNQQICQTLKPFVYHIRYLGLQHMDKKFFEISYHIFIFISQPDNSIHHVCCFVLFHWSFNRLHLWFGQVFSVCLFVFGFFQKITIAIQDGNYHGHYSLSN